MHFVWISLIWLLSCLLLPPQLQCAHIKPANNETTESIETIPLYCTDDRDPQFKLRIGQQGAGPKGTCMLVKCEDVVNGKSTIFTIGCGVFVARPGCKIQDYDKTKLYPDCCPSETC